MSFSWKYSFQGTDAVVLENVLYYLEVNKSAKNHVFWVIIMNARETIFNQFRFLPKLTIYLWLYIDFDETCDKNKVWVLLQFGIQPISQKNFPLMFLYTKCTRPRYGMGCITPTTTC